MASASSIRAGKAYVEFFTKNGPLRRGLQQAQQMVRATADQMRAMGLKMMRTGALVMGAFAVSAPVFTRFDDSMRKVEARASGTASELSKLREQALELGRTTSFTSNNYGDLMAKLGQKGFNRSQISDMTEHVANLARAAGEGDEGDITVAADLVAGTIRAFSLDASDAAEVSDVFTVAVNSSASSLQGLMVSMSNGGAVAADFGLNFKEAVQFFAALTDLNIDPSTAGVALKTVMLRMTSELSRNNFNEELEKLTGRTVDFINASGDLRKPAELLIEIAEATRELGSAARGGLMKDLFGLRGIVGASAVGGSAEQMRKLMDAMNAAAGASKSASELMDAGFGGTLRRIWSAAEGLGIALFEAIVTPMIDMGEKLAKWMTVAAEWIENNKSIVQSVLVIGVTVFALGAALVAAAVPVALFASALGGLASVVTAVTSVVTFMTALLGGLATGILPIVALAAAGVTLQFLASLAAGAAFGAMAFTIAGGWSWLAEKIDAFSAALGPAIEGMAEAVRAGKLDVAFELLWLSIQVGWEELKATLFEDFGGLLEMIADFAHKASQIIKFVFEDMQQNTQIVFDDMRKKYEALAELMDRLHTGPRLDDLFPGTSDSSRDAAAESRARSEELQGKIDELTKEFRKGREDLGDLPPRPDFSFPGSESSLFDPTPEPPAVDPEPLIASIADTINTAREAISSAGGFGRENANLLGQKVGGALNFENTFRRILQLEELTYKAMIKATTDLEKIAGVATDIGAA